MVWLQCNKHARFAAFDLSSALILVKAKHYLKLTRVQINRLEASAWVHVSIERLSKYTYCRNDLAASVSKQ
jgi:hypothetical protein